jgi:electron transfer flavoprotein alpha subunit
MSGEIWIIGESDEGQLGQSTPGVATLGCALAGQAGRVPVGVLVGDGIAEASQAFAAYVPRVLSRELPPQADWVDPTDVAAVIAALVQQRAPAYLLVPGTPSGRVLAGSLAARLGWGIITSAQAVTWAEGPLVETVVFRSETRIDSRFATDHGIITVQPNTIRPAELAAPGAVEHVEVDIAAIRSPIRRVERSRAPAQARIPAQASLEGARVVVAGGAGVGSAEAWPVVEQLAAALRGAVGASRPPVDKGWVPLSIQIGQTGKTIRPDLYVALGISGEILHRVGMRAARTVVAVSLDPDAPFRAHSDLFVVADLHELVPALLAEWRGTPCGHPSGRR